MHYYSFRVLDAFSIYVVNYREQFRNGWLKDGWDMWLYIFIFFYVFKDVATAVSICKFLLQDLCAEVILSTTAHNSIYTIYLKVQ